jgi:membrane dipeptidase
MSPFVPPNLSPERAGPTRRQTLVALAGLAAGDAQAQADDRWWAEGTTIDIHSHAGRVLLGHRPAQGALRPFVPVADAMRAGGMQVICLAIVADSTATHVSADRRRIEPFRNPDPGELYALSRQSFARAQALVAQQQLRVALTTADVRAAAQAGPTVIMASEGADFLEGQLDRVDEAWQQYGLRHLQLTHYRPNELGDIQTEAPEHDGLTDFGAEVVRRCNRLGLVVDVAHGSYALVKRAAAVTGKPLVLSHTSLASRPGLRSRQITADHARLVADTGGVVGVWPNAGVFGSIQDMANGVKRLADAIGIDHVGLGSDMLGFISPPVFQDYQQLPDFANALLAAGFSRDDARKVLGGNYLRVFEASVG